MVRGMFDAYYGQVSTPVIFDTNRGWSARLPLILDLCPQAKILACVRNMAWVMDSLERLYLADPYENTKLFSSEAERSSVYTRVETLGQRTRLVGAAWTNLKDAYFSEQGASMMVIDYDILAQRPEQTLELIYRFLDEPSFAQDFTNTQFSAPEYDRALRIANMHTVRPTVELQQRKSVLPPDLFEQYAKLSFWQDTAGTRCQVLRMGDPK